MKKHKEFREDTVAHVKTIINKVKQLKTSVPDTEEGRAELLDSLKSLSDNLKAGLTVALEARETNIPNDLKVVEKAKDKILSVAKKKDFSVDEINQIDKAFKKEISALKRTFEDLDSNDFVFEFKE